MKALSIAVLTMSLAFASSAAHADAVVTLCQSDNQSGAGINLRDALLKSDPNKPFNTITFQCVDSATIRITQRHIIQSSTIIDGGDNITLDGGGNTSMFEGHDTSMWLYLNNITLRNAGPAVCRIFCIGSVIEGELNVVIGHTSIESSPNAVAVLDGSLSVHDSQFVGNSGSAIFSTVPTTMTIARSVFQNPNSYPIFSTAPVVNITDSWFLNSRHSTFNCQHITIDRSTFQDNKLDGALTVYCDSTITNSSFVNNNSESFGGAVNFTSAVKEITLRADQFLNNSATRGGAIFLPSSDRVVSISHSTFKGNKAIFGGAIDVSVLVFPVANFGRTTINAGAVTFSGNVATANGGAIQGDPSTELSIVRGIFADNQAGESGGAIAVSNYPQIHSVIANTLFVRNKAPATGSAFYGDDAEFINSTVDSNTGLAISLVSPRPQNRLKPIQFQNSIVSNNPQGGCGPGVDSALFVDGGHNLQFPGNDCGPSIAVANPHLDTMYIPIPKSPPMGNGDNNVCLSPPINGRDVYGLGRPQGGACTIGAAEGDIQLLIDRRTKRHPGDCDCGMGLVKALERLLPGLGPP
jgi:predicted outer membrane repeat protein